jgi:hypothetical protein
VLAILGDVEGLFLRAALEGEVNIDLFEIGRGGRLGVVHFHLDFRNHSQQMANVGFHFCFVERGRGGGVRLFLRGKKGGERQKECGDYETAHD